MSLCHLVIRKLKTGLESLACTKCLDNKSFQNEFPRLLTSVPFNIEQNEPMDTKKKKIYR